MRVPNFVQKIYLGFMVCYHLVLLLSQYLAKQIFLESSLFSSEIHSLTLVCQSHLTLYSACYQTSSAFLSNLWSAPLNDVPSAIWPSWHLPWPPLELIIIPVRLHCQSTTTKLNMSCQDLILSPRAGFLGPWSALADVCLSLASFWIVLN